MTTLLVSGIFPPKTGGSGRWFYELYRRLPRDQFLVVAGEDPQQEEFDRSHDLRLVRVPLEMQTWAVKSFHGLRAYWRAIRRLRKLVKEENATMIHCGRHLPEGLMGLALKCWSGTPYGCYIHGEGLFTAMTSGELCLLTRHALRNADFLVANSWNTERILREDWDIPAERIHVMYPGVDTDRFVPAPRSAGARSRLGWGNRPVLLTVGRLQLRKGHDQMILALNTIRQTFPDVLYAIVGDGEERECLDRLIVREKLAEHVQFLGEIQDEDLVTCYQQCDLFVLPNRKIGDDLEGFGMVLLEAQACGKAVVAGDSGGTRETMRIPQTGHIVPCENPNELAQLVARLLGEPARLTSMGQAGREWVVERFDWAALAREAKQLFVPERRQPKSQLVHS
ncbi:MAG TPA: glycosyltransferase family 4 protein [Candidatus Solibacter sp.]|nr:glycosyltransferase family 4 protein [Candidatus Solibacter sp.]